MNNKVLAIISYITLVGWLIAFFLRDKSQKDRLVNFHLSQSLGLAIVSTLFNIALTIVAAIVPSLHFLGYIGYLFFILMILGMINAANEKETPLPLIGNMFVNKFSFIN
ncbi:DUF4870 domain-containing protein [Chryseobacterium gambrini]|uniref:DUF4870 domain-containing protein n=1 Tax=Chryseobacterium gambrini TaxID=373672 RepID=UPI003BA63E2E